MSLIKHKECKTNADYRVVICPNCGERIELKNLGHRYMVLMLFLARIFHQPSQCLQDSFTNSNRG